MTTRTLKTCVIAAGVAFAGSIAGSIAAAQTADPIIGTWKLNVAKSKYDPGPAPKSATATFTVAGKGVKFVLEGVTGTGEKAQWSYTANEDGKDYPMTGNPDADTISLKRIDARTVETTNKKAGKVTTTNRRTVSADGKTLTVTTTGTSSTGVKINNVQVFEKG
jgi:hypothetical protein